MWLNNFKLLDKKLLTHDVYELTFEVQETFNFLAGQFITFLLPHIWWRAYSILKSKWNTICLIIKKVALENQWRWWSIFICEQNIWDTLKWTNPAGNFLLKNNDKNKLFIWTGTWLVPLYNQIINRLKQKNNSKVTLLFWVRYSSDLFYLKELEILKTDNSNFDYHVYLSRDKNTSHNTGYVTDFLTRENSDIYQEFYICWIPDLIDSSIHILKNLWVSENNILSEKY